MQGSGQGSFPTRTDKTRDNTPRSVQLVMLAPWRSSIRARAWGKRFNSTIDTCERSSSASLWYLEYEAGIPYYSSTPVAAGGISANNDDVDS